MNRNETSSLRLVTLSLTFYLVLLAFLVLQMLHQTHGLIIYALDDPYIHLALAENIAHGHYGINPSEFSSPSSSALWPLLLVPFAGTRFHRALPLVLNTLAGSGAAALLGWIVARLFSSWTFARQAVTVILLVFIANLESLTLIGMEHTLQVLLAICCAFALIEALAGRPIPSWCLVAAAIGPSVRYELLSLTLAVCVALALARRWRAAALTGSLSLVPLIAFSAYLHSLGLPLLPTSVLVKASAFSGGTGLDKALSTFRFNLEQALVNHERLPIFALTLFFAALALHIRTAGRRLLFASVSAVGMLQLLFGHFAWFHRYDVYALIFLTLVCLSVVAERPTIFFPYFALGLALLAAPYFEATAQTPLAQSDIYNQQFQMHRFVRSFYTGNYAVNDLGWTSFERRPGAFVLDLYGLGSVEASHHPEASPAWLDDVTRRHHADLAIIYAEWFHVPADWQAMARMCLPSRPVVAAEPCVVFYSTNPAATAAIQADLEAFEPTLPGDISFSLNPHLNPEQIPFERP